MAFWFTTHYPHPRPDTHPWHVYLREEFADVARRFVAGDRVLFFETKYHKPMRDGRRFPVGRRGVVVAATVAGSFEERHASLAVAEYADGTTANWLWNVPTRDADHDGFVGWEDVNDVLGYRDGYTMRGFGVRGSGVRPVTEDQHDRLLGLFRRNRRRAAARV